MKSLHRALDVRSPLQFMRETTGAVFDSLAQIHLIRGAHEDASRSLQRARQAYGETRASGWYQWSVRVLDARIALRRGDAEAALALCGEVIDAPRRAGRRTCSQAELTAVEALLALSRARQTRRRGSIASARASSRGAMSGTWGEFLRLRGRLHAAAGRATEAYHDFGQSLSVFELLGERYQSALGSLELGRLSAAAGARSRALRYLTDAPRLFEALGASPDSPEADAVLSASLGTAPDRRATSACRPTATTRSCGGWWTRPPCRRCWNARPRPRCSKPATLRRQRSSSSCRPARLRVLAPAGCDADGARALASAAAARHDGPAPHRRTSEPIGRDIDGAAVRRHRRREAVAAGAAAAVPDALRGAAPGLRAVPGARAHAGTARRRASSVRSSRCCQDSSAPVAPMHRVADQIQRLQGNDLTVLITGESGTGKDLVARAIHAGSLRRANMFLPYNCTSATRELADSQLFGHRRGSFTGAVSDQPGVLRTAVGGTLFLDEIGDLPHRRPAEAPAVPRAGRGAAGRRNAPASASTSASSRRPTPISSSASPTGSSARISSTG